MPSLFLKAVSPIAKVIPSVKKPEKDPGFRVKIFWTLVAVMLYIIMTTVPLYGIQRGAGIDVFWTLRVILASERGTLAELGIGPIVTGGLILEILVGSRLINVDLTDPEDRIMFNNANKAMAVIMTIFESLVYIIGGAYGSLDLGAATLVFVQLLMAGIIIILLDEMVQKEGVQRGEKLYRHRFVAGLIKLLVEDFMENSKEGAENFRQDLPIVATLDAKEKLPLGFSEETATQLKILKKLLLKKLYKHEKIARKMYAGKQCIKGLYKAFTEDADLLPVHQQELFEVRKNERVVADYIAAMTDRYAMKTYHEVYGLSL